MTATATGPADTCPHCGQLMPPRPPSIPDELDTRQVAALFDVSVDTVKVWRRPIYAQSPLQLLPTRYDPPTATGKALYDWDTLHSFTQRNPQYSLHVRRATANPRLQGQPL